MKILLVEDSATLRYAMRNYIIEAGHTPLIAQSGEEALQMLETTPVDMIIMDVEMPVKDGIDACRMLKENAETRKIPVILFTSLAKKEDIARGLKVGADDYITKPIKPKVLVSKIKALLRRVSDGESVSSQDTGLQVNVGDIIIDREEYVIIKDGEKLSLPRKEFELFSLLASKPGKVFKRDDILDSVWGNEVVVGGRTIDVHIRKLREKIGDANFKTIKGVGYKFVIDED